MILYAFLFAAAVWVGCYCIFTYAVDRHKPKPDTSFNVALSTIFAVFFLVMALMGMAPMYH